MKTTLRTVIALITISILSGCVSLERKLHREFEKVKRGPANATHKSITNFSPALACMDRMMLDYQIKDIPMLVENIEDKTEAVKAGTRDMIISAISEMTKHSKGIKLITYGKDSANLISFMKSAKHTSPYKTMPLYDIQGSISQYDKSMVSRDNSLGLFYRGEGGLGYARSASLSQIALDLNIVRTSDMSIVSGVTSHNVMTIFESGRSWDTDASINKLGIYFDMNFNRSEGKTQAVRSLVELGAIELVGKLTKVPYWRCLGAKTARSRY